MLSKILDEYNNAVFETDRARAFDVVHNAFAGGVSAEEIVFKIVIPSIEHFLEAVSSNQASLAQHFITSQIAADIVEEMLPKFAQAPESAGTIVIGTSHGDYHGLGKRIVSGCLVANMLQVIDLGLSVSADTFVDAALENNASVIGISSMMVHTARGDNGCRGVRRILKERGLENSLKIIVGGAPYRFDEQLYEHVGADAWAENGLAAAGVIKSLIREVKP